MFEFKTEMFPYQREAFEKLSKVKVGALYMEQGTGKTRTALALINKRLDDKKVHNVLWLCPCTAKDTGNIKNDIIKHIGFFPQNFYICGIESLSSSIRIISAMLDYVMKHKTYLIVDESNLVKNPYAIRTENVTRLAACCEYKLLLNGTPVTRNEIDLFAQWYILDWRILGYRSYWSFSANHVEYDVEHPNRIRRCLNVEYLSRKIAPYSYQVKKADCMALPDKSYSTQYFYITEAQEFNYWEAGAALLDTIDEFHPETIYRFFSVLQKITAGYYCKINGSRTMSEPMFDDFKENPRVQKLLEMLPSYRDNKVMIFCKYTFEIDGIMQVLTDIYGEGCAVRLDGKMGKRARQKSLEDFAGAAQFFVSNKTCAGYSLNLQFCHNIIYYNQDWDYGTRAQSEDRVHRIGQTKPVSIVDIVADNTVENKIITCVYRKENLAEEFKKQLKSLNKKEILQKWAKGEKGGKRKNVP